MPLCAAPLLDSPRQAEGRGGERGRSDPIESDCFCSYRFELRLHLREERRGGGGNTNVDSAR